MGMFKRLAMGAIAVIATAALVQPADATQFRWSQHGGFVLDPGGSTSIQSGEGPESAPVAPGSPPRPGQGGLEFFDLQAAPAPVNTYRVVGWGCTPDGNNSPGIGVGNSAAAATCAQGASTLIAASANDPLNSAAGVRSALSLDVFTSETPSFGPPFGSQILDSDTQNVVVIARINHFNRVIDNEANTLFTVQVDANLIIRDLGGNPIFTDANSVPIGFRETLNVTSGTANCAQPNPLGSTCDDVFTFDASQFANVPFEFNGEDFFLQFGLAPVPECDTLVDTVGTIQVFQCDDNAAHRVALDFQNGRAWASEGFDNAFLVTMFVTEEQIGVPAPAGVALLGLGLGGLGLVGAWRKRKSAV
jgi:hypothetical protein